MFNDRETNLPESGWLQNLCQKFHDILPSGKTDSNMFQAFSIPLKPFLESFFGLIILVILLFTLLLLAFIISILEYKLIRRYDRHEPRLNNYNDLARASL